MYLAFYPSICTILCLSIYLCFLSINLAACLSKYLDVKVSVCLSVCQVCQVCQSVSLSVRLCLCICFYLNNILSIYRSAYWSINRPICSLSDLCCMMYVCCYASYRSLCRAIIKDVFVPDDGCKHVRKSQCPCHVGGSQDHLSLINP